MAQSLVNVNSLVIVGCNSLWGQVCHFEHIRFAQCKLREKSRHWQNETPTLACGASVSRGTNRRSKTCPERSRGMTVCPETEMLPVIVHISSGLGSHAQSSDGVGAVTTDLCVITTNSPPRSINFALSLPHDGAAAAACCFSFCFLYTRSPLPSISPFIIPTS